MKSPTSNRIAGGTSRKFGFKETRELEGMEAQIHAIGVVMLLGLMLYVTFANDLGLGSK